VIAGNLLQNALDILLVADDPESLWSMHTCILKIGHQPRTAQSGAEALALVRIREPDLVLVDLRGPDFDGFELTRQLRLINSDHLLKVILVMASNADLQVIRALQSGADYCLQHPVNVFLLDATFRHFVGVQTLQSRLARVAQRQLDIIDNINDAVITIDAKGQIEDMNRMAFALFDPRPSTDTDLPVFRGDCSDLLGLSLEQLTSQRECKVRCANGSLLSVDVNFKQWEERGRVRHTLVLRDLTERRAVELMKNDFLATVSHELRTPLTAVLGALGLLAGGAVGQLPAAARRLAEVAQRNGKRLSRLIDDILDMTKVSTDQFTLDCQRQSVGPLMQEALVASQAYASSLGVQLEADGVEAHGGTELSLDAGRFLQVMGNLLSNAIKHSPAGEVVQLRLVMTPSSVVVSVIDRGPGIDAAFRSQLFKQFSKAEGRGLGEMGNSGLGLYISRLLVERMGGQIAADPAGLYHDVGASFSVAFPLLQEQR